MKRLLAMSFVCLSITAYIGPAKADDRLILTANGFTLTDTSGGGGGGIGWIHDFRPGLVAGAAADYQTIEDAHWAYGSLTGAVTGGAEGRKWSLYGEVHKGSGDDDAHHFTYQVAAVGASLPLFRGLSLDLEDRQIDIDTTHGNLPKVGLTMLWNPHWQTSVSYANSVGGNLATDITAARLDYYERKAHFLLGGAVGNADPVVLNLQPGVVIPTRRLHQAFIGAARTFQRTELLVLVDYLELGTSERVTLTLNATIQLGRREKPK